MAGVTAPVANGVGVLLGSEPPRADEFAFQFVFHPRFLGGRSAAILDPRKAGGRRPRAARFKLRSPVGWASPPCQERANGSGKTVVGSSGSRQPVERAAWGGWLESRWVPKVPPMCWHSRKGSESLPRRPSSFMGMPSNVG